MRFPAVWLMLVLVLNLTWICDVKAKVGVSEGTIVVNGRAKIATTDENFVCATLDWWPAEKCDYGTCSWGNASLHRLNLKNPILLNAVKAFSPLKIRLGGTLQDKLYYQTEADLKKPCNGYIKNSSALFGFNEGCLSLARWDELNSFFKDAGVYVIFGLDALRGKVILPNGSAVGRWNPTNAASFIKYTLKKGYNIYGYELGNELSGVGVGVRIDSSSYASDTLALHDLVENVYKNVRTTKSLIIAPGGFFDYKWFQDFIAKTKGILDAVTQHIYNLGPGNDEHLIQKILNPSVLDSGAGVLRDLSSLVQPSTSRVQAWVSESAGVYNSGRKGVTNTFVFGFWYLDQLGQASRYNTKMYCRQTLIGGNYGLLDTTTFNPNPDYYNALLWHRLMGKTVLSVNFNGTNKLRAFSHCAKQSKGVTLLLINTDRNTTFQLNVKFDGASIPLQQVLAEGSKEEYHLTPKNGDIQSQAVLLNGEPLLVGPKGNIPVLKPRTTKSSEPITIAPYSIVFVHMPFVAIPACRAA